MIGKQRLILKCQVIFYTIYSLRTKPNNQRIHLRTLVIKLKQYKKRTLIRA